MKRAQLLLFLFIGCCGIGCSDVSVPYSGVWEETDDTASPDGGSDEPSDTDIESVSADSDSDTGGDSGSGDADTGMATASDTEGETVSVEDTVTATDSATASETVSTGVDQTDESSDTGETSTGVTATDTGSTSDEPSDTWYDDSDTYQDYWEDPTTQLIWERFDVYRDIPEGGSLLAIQLRCSNKGMRLPTELELRTIVDNCPGFLTGCTFDEEIGYTCPGPRVDLTKCPGPYYNKSGSSYDPVLVVTSSVAHDTLRVQFRIPGDSDGYPEVQFISDTQQYDNLTTMCVK